MKLIKVIVTDLDNTLLKSEKSTSEYKSISQYTVDIIKKCRDAGIIFAIATARSERASERYINALNPDVIISNGGAKITYQDKVILKNMMSAETTDKIISACLKSKNHGQVTVETDFGYYHSDKNDVFTGDYSYAEYHDFTYPLNQEAYKITTELADSDTANDIVSGFPDCEMMMFSGESWYRFARRDATKWNAVVKLSEALCIPTENFIAFGDDYNDTEMIANCGIGVSVENAIDEVKQASDFICGSNENDGVAEFLEMNVINRRKI